MPNYINPTRSYGGGTNWNMFAQGMGMISQGLEKADEQMRTKAWYDDVTPKMKEWFPELFDQYGKETTSRANLPSDLNSLTSDSTNLLSNQSPTKETLLSEADTGTATDASPPETAPTPNESTQEVVGPQRELVGPQPAPQAQALMKQAQSAQEFADFQRRYPLYEGGLQALDRQQNGIMADAAKRLPPSDMQKLMKAMQYMTAASIKHRTFEPMKEMQNTVLSPLMSYYQDTYKADLDSWKENNKQRNNLLEQLLLGKTSREETHQNKLQELEAEHGYKMEENKTKAANTPEKGAITPSIAAKAVSDAVDQISGMKTSPNSPYGRSASRLNALGGAEAILNNPKVAKTKQAVYEMVMSLVSSIGGSNRPAAQSIAKIVPRSMWGDSQAVKQYIFGQPETSITDSMVNQLRESFKTEEKYHRGVMDQAIQSKKAAIEPYLKKHPEGYEAAKKIVEDAANSGNSTVIDPNVQEIMTKTGADQEKAQKIWDQMQANKANQVGK